MNIKKKLIFLLITFLMSLFLPTYAMALGFAPIDTNGQLLYFGGRPAPYARPVLIAGTCPSGKTCSADGSGSVNGVGAQYKYTNVITINGVQVDAYVTVTAIDSAASITNFDYPTPNPGGGTSYTTKAGSGIASQSIPEAAVFAPRITVSGTGSVTFLIEFKDTSGKPVALKNVYNNSVDIEDVEVVEYGGFSSYELSNISPIPSGNGANCSTPGGTGSVKAYLGTNNQVKFKGGVGVCVGLYLEEFARIQTKFDTISSLKIKMGQENGNGIRYYGSIFVHDELTNAAGSTKTVAPTVNTLITTDTTPSITGTIGGTVSTASPLGSSITGTDTFTVNVGGTTYTYPNANLVVTGVNWKLNVPTALTVGQTYEVTATRNAVLVDQTSNELTISPICQSTQVLNITKTTCVTPTSTDVVLCHTGDVGDENGDGVENFDDDKKRNYAKIIISTSGENGHETHEHDYAAVNDDLGNKKCPSEPVDCNSNHVRDDATNTCVPPTPATCPTLEAVSATIPSYALSSNGKKVTICHNTSSSTNPLVSNTIDINALDSHITEHSDYFTKSGVCPTDAVPCPPIVCTLPYVVNATNTACYIPDVSPTVDLGQKATDYAVPLITGGVFGTSTSLTITAQNLTTKVVYPIGTATKTASGGWTVTGATILPAGTYDVIATGDSGLTDGSSNELTVSAGLTPTVDSKVAIEGSPVALTGKPGSSLAISSVTLTKYKDGLGAAVVGSTVSVGSSITSGQTSWTTPTPSAMYETVGEYTITATDGNGKTGTNTLTVTCPTGKIATADSCIIANIPTVNDKQTANLVAVTLDGNIGTSTTISSVTLTKIKDGTGAAVSSATPISVSGTPFTVANGATTWSISSGQVPLGVYTITVTDNNSKTATGTLTVDCGTTGKTATATGCSVSPTVVTQTTFDTTPIIEGTVGAVALETGEAFTVSVNGKTYTNGVDTNLVVTGTGWKLTILVDIPGSATAYPVVATRGSAPDTTTGTGQLTITPCALPKVVNSAKTACVDPVPTVVSQTINSNVAVAPVIKGTVGEVALGSTETFSVTIKTTPPQIYTHATPETELKVTGLTWTLTVPSNKAIVAGTYDVEAARNTSAKNAAPHGELVINLVCLGTETAINGACVAKTFLPTVNSDSTPDTTPTITGTVGSSMLATNETFTVKVDGISFTPTISNTDTTWSVAIPVANALSVGVHPVEATRGDLTGSGTITITQCTSPKVVSATTGDCSEPSLVPTVTPSANHNIRDPSIVVAGTVGDIELTAQERSSNAFGVKVYNSEHSDVKGVLTVDVHGINWTFTLTERFAGTFNVDAKRNDKTGSGTLVITGSLCCVSGVTTQCPGPISVPDYTGECNVPVCPTTNAAGNCTSALPDPKKDETFPNQPTSKVEEAIKPPADLGTCDDGGKRSYGDSMSGITIKRARIANAETIGGTLESNALVEMQVMYGTLTAGSYDDSDNTCQQGYCVGKKITGATLTGAIVDITNDYVDAAGNIIDSSNRGIALTGGVTNHISYKKDGVTPIIPTITNGMITAGTDSAGNPVRGSITNGQFTDSITNNTSVLTKGRRTQGTLTNATITGATITTVNGVSVVGCDRSLDSTHTPCTVGVIKSGTMDSTGIKTFGTVENATLTGATITNSNQCFSSGTVGSKGQLNWKEVVK